MRVFVSVDMEGISGIISPDYVTPEKKFYEEGKKLMLHDTLAVVEKTLEMGAEEVIINDSHGYMDNLTVSSFPEKTKLIIGSPKPLSMLQGVEECNLAFFVGYHSGIGTPYAIMEHSYSSATVYNLKINGEYMNEVYINSLIAGYFNVPVAFVSGDETTTKHASKILENVITVSVKKAISRTSALCLPLSETKKLLQEGVERVFEIYRKDPNTFKPKRLSPPYTFEIEFLNTQMADAVSIHPDVKRLDGRRIFFQRDDLLEAYNLFRILLIVARNSVF
ncbi:MAG: M55 family metallopeptidase [Dictyoglomaceae bacterium]